MPVTPEYANFEESTRPDDLDIEAVHKFNWKEGDFRDYFGSALSAISNNIGERLIASVASDDHPRKLATYHVNADSIAEFASDMSRKGLSWETLDSDPGADVKYGGDDPSTQYAVIGSSMDVVDEYVDAASIADPVERHRAQGELLGYPSCCVDAFVHRVLEGHRTDTKYESACDTDDAEAVDDRRHVRVTDPHATTNTFWRYKGWTLLDHQPCSFDCDGSHELAVANGTILREIGLSDEADRLWEWLSTPVTWSAFHGLAHVRNNFAMGEYVTDDNWAEKIVQFNGEHERKGTLPR